MYLRTLIQRHYGLINIFLPKAPMRVFFYLSSPCLVKINFEEEIALQLVLEIKWSQASSAANTDEQG